MQQRIKNSIVKFLNTVPSGRILDIPAGTGWLRRALKGDQWEYHGADLFTTPDMANFSIADLNRDLPYETSSFDYVSCLEGLEHIENYHHALREFARVLKPGGLLLVSTPNPLNIKSRRRYFWRGTFSGFPHLVRMPDEGEHVHISPINLSFLISFAEKYHLKLHKVHPVKIPLKMYRFIPQCMVLKGYTMLRYRSKDAKVRRWMNMLSSRNVLLNDGMVVSFQKSN